MSTVSAALMREAVREAYGAAALSPEAKHPFPVGREFARSVGYGEEWLDQAPAAAVDAFAGVSNVAVSAPLEAGMRVVDLGCGAGLDLWIAARRAGPRGRVCGIDFSAEMLRRTRLPGMAQASAEQLPLRDAEADMVLVNGIFNLNPRRGEIFAELARVTKPGGAVFGAELVLQGPLPEEMKSGAANWFS